MFKPSETKVVVKTINGHTCLPSWLHRYVRVTTKGIDVVIDQRWNFLFQGLIGLACSDHENHGRAFCATKVDKDGLAVETDNCKVMSKLLLQKYFQKLAKARQNGEEGEVTMEGGKGNLNRRRAANLVTKAGHNSILSPIPNWD